MSYPCGSVISATPLHDDAILHLCLIAAKALHMTVSDCLAYCHISSDNVATLALRCLESK